MDAFFSRVILLIALLWVNPSGAHDVGCDPRIPVTTNEYVSAFWPLWLSINQFELEPANTLIGPETITPVYQAIVAINVDTLYASSSIDVSKEPAVLIVPSSNDVGYSVLMMDAFGYNYHVGIPNHPAGETFDGETYVLVGPSLRLSEDAEWNASISAANATLINLPHDYMVVIFRSDIYSENGTDLTQESNDFRSNLQLLNLTSYESQPDYGKTKIIPVEYYSAPFKVLHDTLVQETPITYLKMVQKALGSAIVPPLSDPERVIRDQFDAIFSNENAWLCYAEFAAGAQGAFQDIVNNYLGSTDGNGWIHFVDITQWNATSQQGRLNRASTTEYIQWANGIDTAAYYHTFVDSVGNPLDGSGGQQYTITFNEIPEAERFWSVTAYTQNSVELIPNDADKYHVASYTPGLEYGQDGSLTLYMSAIQPSGVSEANWLPLSTSNGPFNVMLRIYGVVPNSTIASNTYEPPPVVLAK